MINCDRCGKECSLYEYEPMGINGRIRNLCLNCISKLRNLWDIQTIEAHDLFKKHDDELELFLKEGGDD